MYGGGPNEAPQAANVPPEFTAVENAVESAIQILRQSFGGTRREIAHAAAEARRVLRAACPRKENDNDPR